MMVPAKRLVVLDVTNIEKFLLLYLKTINALKANYRLKKSHFSKTYNFLET